MKYRYVITNEGTVEADTTVGAEAAAFEALELGSGIYVCEIEPLPGEARGMSNATEYEAGRAEAAARLLAAYTAWFEGKGNDTKNRAAFVSAAFDLTRLMREGVSGE